MDAIDIRQQIKDSLHACGKDVDFASAATAMLSTLGYASTRAEEVESEPKAFIKRFPPLNSKINTISEQEFVAAAKSVHLLFQFGETEIKEAKEKEQNVLPLNYDKERFAEGNIKSFLFLAVELKEGTYRRKDYAAFTREINKRFYMPSVVLFRCGDAKERRVTLSFVWRRVSETDSALDVLGRVSLLREIVCHKPHRGHLDILAELTLDNRLLWIDKNKTGGFEGLLAAWLDELDAEALNQRFYFDLREWFDRVINNKKVKFPVGKVTVQQQVVRMVSRLLFIWFMKEKKLVCDDLFSEARMHEVLKDYNAKGDSYYRAILQNLFFATLNTEIDNRGFSSTNRKTHRISSLYRYKDLMQKGKHEEVLDMMKETPFVNGGLFDCLDDFEGVKKGGKRVDCFTDWQNHRDLLSVPNSLFFGEKGVFNIFEKYKFTVEENTPIEQEVALDPELLGKVFENLLAYVDRKETGSYYTPRIVVDYMVRESLVAYFVRTIETDNKNLHERIRSLLSAEVEYESLPESKKLNESESDKFVTAMGDLRLLDPAVGSGAFPMGALQQMTMALKRVDPKNKFLKKRELEIAKKHSDSEIRGNSIALVEDAFSEDNQYNNYGRKLSLIRNCLYGVDIQPIAVQICRLRFFISLLIEQQEDKTKKNHGIRPLPNIDAKIIAANTLIKIVKPGDESNKSSLFEANTEELVQDILNIRQFLFDAQTRYEKRKCRVMDKRARRKLGRYLAKNGYSPGNVEKIVDWDLYDQNTAAGWFDAKWMFIKDNDFDIIIANPPYIRLQVENGRLANLYEPVEYKTFTRGGDIYCLFYERAVELLKDEGCFCYITSNKFMRTQYGKALRGFLLGCTELQKIIDFGELPVFQAGTDPAIIMGSKKQAEDNAQVFVATIKQVPEIYQLSETVNKLGFSMSQKLLSKDGWSLVQESVVLLVEKIHRVGIALNDYANQRVHRGITTGLDEAFVINREQRQKILDVDQASEELIKPYLLGGEIKKWYADREDWYVIYTRKNTRIDKYPGVKGHLLRYKDRLQRRAAPEKEYWYALQAPYIVFDGVVLSKIAFNETSKELHAFIDYDELYVNKTAFVVFSDDNEYLLGIMNSELMDFYYRHIFPAWGDPWNRGRVQFQGVRMKQVPIVDANPAQRREISSRVKKILADPRGKQVAKLETEIDELVYALYELTKEEIALVKEWQSNRIS